MTFPVWSGNNEALVSQQIVAAPSFASYTALDGGGAEGAPVLTAHINLISTVGTSGDSVVMPPATTAGQTIHVVNWSGTENTLTVFGFGDDTVFGSSSQSIGPYTSFLLLCNTVGNWVPISYVNWD